MNFEYTCEFSNPQTWDGETPANLVETWNFKNVSCEGIYTPDTIELIINETYPTREFYVQKTLTYGEAILIWFLTIFIIFSIGKMVFNFLWKK